MRIGTWNLDGRWDERHLNLTNTMRCDILLLTEVSERVAIPGHRLHATALRMVPRRHWAAVAAPDLTPLPDPHGASAMAEINGLRVVSSVLPWRRCGGLEPWSGQNTAERTVNAVQDIEAAQPVIWGGDWNHAPSGPETSGSHIGRAAIAAAVQRLGLNVATDSMPHVISGLVSIDHVAIPGDWAAETEHHPAVVGGVRISDHDAYVAEVSESPLAAT